MDWAIRHPYALQNPTPDNSLYINTSLLDFGKLSVKDFDKAGKIEAQNLFSVANSLASVTNPHLRATVYALGRVNMILVNPYTREVSIVNDKATDYDWNEGGGFCRNTCIKIHNKIYKIDPKKHGFKAYYYGIGRLRIWPHIY